MLRMSQSAREKLDSSCKITNCVCLVIDHEFRHIIVEVAVDPRGDAESREGRLFSQAKNTAQRDK